MATLYLSTDAFFAETVIEDTEYNQLPVHTYSNISIGEGVTMADKIGFNPP